ncbi:MAG: hypothetical protein KA746_04350 [Pyrinomonadaceae bacterium]|nr:hypothetical protein [Pyrinomonadaceae bacterium]MBP6213688.1 hypothetical protein [Pyrinomonadaceae bacterium]
MAVVSQGHPTDSTDSKDPADPFPAPFDLGILRQRYHDELRPYLAIPEREDLTLNLWIDMITEDRSTSQNRER